MLTLHSLVSIAQFNGEQADKVFERVKTEKQLVVLKDDMPLAVIISPDEYERFTALERGGYVPPADEAQPMELKAAHLNLLQDYLNEDDIWTQLGISPDLINLSEE